MVKATASGGVLEIQMIADMAQFLRSMDQMRGEVSRSTGVATKEMARAEKQAESFAKALEFEAATMGMTAKQTKMLQVELKALSAEQAGLDGLAQRMRAASAAMNDNDVPAKQAAMGMKNLAFQAQDLGVQLSMAAGSSNPLKGAMMALVMQGPQIKDALDQTGKSAFQLAGGFLRAHPILAAVGVAAGVTAGAFALFADELDKTNELDRYAASLGLTKEEMAKLGDVSVTTGDVFKGLWRTIDEGLGASRTFSLIKTWAVDAFKTTLGWIQTFISAAHAAFAGTANAAIAMAQAAKQALTGDFAGALATIKSIPDGYSKAFNQAEGAMKSFFDAVARNTMEVARERVFAQAHELIDKRSEAKAKERAAKVGKTLGETLAESMEEAMIKLRNMKPIVDVEDIYRQWGRDWEETTRKNEEILARQSEERAEQDRKARERALKTAYDIADIIGGGVGDAIKNLADALQAAFPDFMRTIGDAIEKMTGAAEGQFKELFKQMSAGAQIGNATAGIMKGLGIKTSTTGAEIGGALGSYFGPLGALGGSILGGVIGGLFKSVKKASATIELVAGEAAMTSLVGNSSKMKATASAMADSLIGGLLNIADQLGGMLGDGIKISIGQRDKTFRVDLEGLGRTKGMPKFQTEAEAVAFALQQAIMQGAITGLRAGTETLIKAQGDLEAQLQKAMQFEGVFRELKQRTDPLGFALEELDKQFAKLRDVFEEAGASAADYAALEQLFALKRQEAIEQNTKAAEVVGQSNAVMEERAALERQLMELEGRTADIRAQELAALDESNRALQERIWALQDEAVAAEQAAAAASAVASQRSSLQRQLLELNGDTAAIRQMDLEGIDASNQELLKQIWARQDAIAAEQAAQAAAAAAQQAAAQAAAEAQRQADEAARAAQQLVDAWKSVGEAIMDEVKRIRGGMMPAGQSYSQLQAQFAAATDAARAGNMDAAKSLPELSRQLIEAAQAAASDELMIKRIKAVTAASLEQTFNTIGSAMGFGGPEAPADTLQRFADNMAASSNSGATGGSSMAVEIRALREEVAGLRKDNNSGNAQIIGQVGRVNQSLDEAISEGEGALGVRLVA